MFQMRTVFVFTENWSRDQLMQKAYLLCTVAFHEFWTITDIFMLEKNLPFIVFHNFSSPILYLKLLVNKSKM